MPSSASASSGLTRFHSLVMLSLREALLLIRAKVKDVLEWETPQTVKEVRSFLGLAGYYRRFIENFSKIAKPLTSLLEKNVAFVWTDERQRAFDELKKRLTTAPVLTLPDQTKRFTVYCDASKDGLGCVLMQEGR